MTINIKNSLFEKCAVGDYAQVFNFMQNLELKDDIVQLLQEIQKIGDQEEKNRLAMLVTEFAKQIEGKNKSAAQSIWDQIKEGLKTAGSATTIIVHIGHLLGFL